MKKRIKKDKILCAALTTILVLGNYTGTTVYAASDDNHNRVENTFSTRAPSIRQLQLTCFLWMPVRTEKMQSDDASDTLSTAPDLTDEELAAYYDDSVFIGDSIMSGFRNYSAKQESFVHDIQFLAAGSYSAFNAMKPVTEDNVHPVYRGKKCQVWNAIPLMGVKRVFILLGMNDISILGLEGARDQYKELISKILETSPDLEIHIISVTYTLKDQGIGKLNNENIAKYNILLQEMAEENDWGYIDLCTPISDGDGNLAEECCSDNFVHLSPAAYTQWEAELIDYANAQAKAKEEADSSEADETINETKSKYESILETPASNTIQGRKKL